MTAIAQYFVADFARACAVDQHASDRRFAGDAGARGIKREDVAVLDEDRFRLRVAAREHTPGDTRVLHELPVLAVDRYEEARLHERQHQLGLFLAAVSRDVDLLDAFVDDFGAAAAQVIDDAADGLLVAGNRARREDDRVVRLQLHVAVVVDGDA